MPEKKEEEKPSSLRMRLARTRQTYRHKKTPVPIIIGVIVVAVGGVALYLAFTRKGSRPRRPTPTVPVESEELGERPSTSAAPEPKTVGEKVWLMITEAKDLSREDPAGAVEKLNALLREYPQYEGEIYFAMGVSMQRPNWTQKAEYYEKAKAAFQAGSPYLYGNEGMRMPRLEILINTSRRKARE